MELITKPFCSFFFLVMHNYILYSWQFRKYTYIYTFTSYAIYVNSFLKLGGPLKNPTSPNLRNWLRGRLAVMKVSGSNLNLTALH